MQSKTDNVCITVTLCCGRVTMVDLEKQCVVHILGVGLLSYLTSMQIACPVLFYRLFRVWPYYIFFTLSHKQHNLQKGSY
jgi:hypothetical protein